MRRQTMKPSEAAQLIAQEVCQILGITIEDHFWLRVDTMIAYLDRYLPGEEFEYDRHTLRSSTFFCNWWNNHWKLRDEEFLLNAGFHYVTPDYYSMLHDPERLADGVTPNSIVLDNSYAEMIGKVNEQMAVKP